MKKPLKIATAFLILVAMAAFALRPVVVYAQEIPLASITDHTSHTTPQVHVCFETLQSATNFRIVAKRTVPEVALVPRISRQRSVFQPVNLGQQSVFPKLSPQKQFLVLRI